MVVERRPGRQCFFTARSIHRISFDVRTARRGVLQRAIRRAAITFAAVNRSRVVFSIAYQVTVEGQAPIEEPGVEQVAIPFTFLVYPMPNPS